MDQDLARPSKKEVEDKLIATWWGVWDHLKREEGVPPILPDSAWVDDQVKGGHGLPPHSVSRFTLVPPLPPLRGASRKEARAFHRHRGLKPKTEAGGLKWEDWDPWPTTS